MATRGRKLKVPTLSGWVADRVEEHCEAGGDRNAPLLADTLMQEVPMMLVVTDARALLLRYVGQALRARYSASIPQADGTVRYEQPRLMGWDDMLLSVNASIRLGGALMAKAARTAEEWLSEYPDTGLTVADIIEAAQALSDAQAPEGFEPTTV